MANESEYVFAAERDRSNERFSALAELYDAATTGCIEARGATRGWDCLEVGAGGGSVARWLAQRVSPGRVVATDRDVTALSALAISNLEIWHHDIASDPLPPCAFDLAHARLVLMHLANPSAAVDTIIRAVRPGGWVVLEEFDVPQPDPEEALATVPKTSVAFRLALERSGVDTRCGRRLPSLMRAHGLVSIGGEGRTSLWSAAAGGAGTRLMRANYVGLRDAMIATGHIRDDEIDADLMRLSEPDFVVASPTMWTVWGRVPGGA